VGYRTRVRIRICCICHNQWGTGRSPGPVRIFFPLFPKKTSEWSDPEPRPSLPDPKLSEEGTKPSVFFYLPQVLLLLVRNEMVVFVHIGFLYNIDADHCHFDVIRIRIWIRGYMPLTKGSGS